MHLNKANEIKCKNYIIFVKNNNVEKTNGLGTNFLNFKSLKY